MTCVLALAVLAGCSGDGDGDDAAAPPSTTAPPGCAPAGAAPFEGTLSVHVPPGLAQGQSVTWNITLTNGSQEPFTLQFASAQNAEITLTAADGAEAYRWSDGRTFAQAIRCEELDARAANSFLLTTDRLDVPPGTYTLRGSVLADGAPPPVERPVTIS